MKRVLQMSLVALLIAGGTACSKDDKDDDTSNQTALTAQEQAVQGDWKMKEQEQEGSSVYDGDTVSSHTGTGSNFAGLVSFKADKTFESNLSYDATIITTTMGFSPDTTVSNLEGFSSAGTWSMNADGDLEVSADGEAAQTVEMVSITATEMVWRLATEVQQTYQGITAINSVSTTIVLEKQ